MRIDELTQLAWEDVAQYGHVDYMKFRMAVLLVPAVVNLHTIMTVATPSSKYIGKHME
jgi:hypothetical protein